MGRFFLPIDLQPNSLSFFLVASPSLSSASLSRKVFLVAPLFSSASFCIEKYRQTAMHVTRSTAMHATPLPSLAS